LRVKVLLVDDQQVVVVVRVEAEHEDGKVENLQQRKKIGCSSCERK
jgi:hypothetical protein